MYVAIKFCFLFSFEVLNCLDEIDPCLHLTCVGFHKIRPNFFSKKTNNSGALYNFSIQNM